MSQIKNKVDHLVRRKLPRWPIDTKIRNDYSAELVEQTSQVLIAWTSGWAGYLGNLSSEYIAECFGYKLTKKRKLILGLLWSVACVTLTILSVMGNHILAINSIIAASVIAPIIFVQKRSIYKISTVIKVRSATLHIDALDPGSSGMTVTLLATRTDKLNELKLIIPVFECSMDIYVDDSPPWHISCFPEPSMINHDGTRMIGSEIKTDQPQIIILAWKIGAKNHQLIQSASRKKLLAMIDLSNAANEYTATVPIALEYKSYGQWVSIPDSTKYESG